MKLAAHLAASAIVAVTASARAETKQLYNNLSYHPLREGMTLLTEALGGRETRNGKISGISFHYNVTSPRDSSSGQASGKRANGAIMAKAIDPRISDLIASQLGAGKSGDAEKTFKKYLVDLAHIGRPVDVNAEVAAIARKLIATGDPELNHRLDELAEAVGDYEANRVRIHSLNEKINDCGGNNDLQLVTSLCSNDFIMELLEKLAESKDRTDSLTEMTATIALRLQLYMERRQKMIETISNLIEKMDETADSIVNNLK